MMVEPKPLWMAADPESAHRLVDDLPVVGSIAQTFGVLANLGAVRGDLVGPFASEVSKAMSLRMVDTVLAVGAVKARPLMCGRRWHPSRRPFPGCRVRRGTANILPGGGSPGR